MYSVERDVPRPRSSRRSTPSPIETERKCVVLLEADRLNPESSNTLLKSIEEPPPRTIIILVTESAAELLDTIRSRCQRIDFGALGTDVLLAELERRGVPEADARGSRAALAGGRLDRAVALDRAARRVCATRSSTCPPASTAPARPRSRWPRASARSSRTRSPAWRPRSRRELDELEEEIERRQYAPRTAQAMRKRVTDRQKREARRLRVDAVLEGITAIESVYRDALADGVAADQPRP